MQNANNTAAHGNQNRVIVKVRGDHIAGAIDVDVTDKLLGLTLETIHRLGPDTDDGDYEPAYLVDPEAIGIAGPFYVQAYRPVCEFFGVRDLVEITSAMLADARQLALH